MTQPRAYVQTTNFNDHSTVSPNDPHSGANLDTEFVELKQNLDDLNANIGLLQRDDGKLLNTAVHKDSFDQDALAFIGASGSGFTARGDWVTATDYFAGDLVTNNAATYITVVAEHESGATFAGDKTAGKWTLIANSAIETSSASVNTHSGDGATYQFDTTYTYSTPGDIQVFVEGEIQPTTAYSITNLASNSTTGNNITFLTAPPTNTNNVIIWGATVVAEIAKQQALTYKDSSNNHKVTSERWSDKVDGSVVDAETSVDSTEYSSKAYAIGGVGINQTAGKGSSKEWAIGTGRIDDQSTGGYSAKEHATGNTVAEGSSKEWATNAGTAEVDTGEGYSSKAYAQDDANDIGSSKDWAMKVSAQVASTDYSAKEYAVGTTVAAGSAKDWAVLAEDSVVDGGSGYSALHYAAKAAADLVLTNADVVSTNADVVTTAGYVDAFDDKYLGSHTTTARETGGNVGKDNDGDALDDGALYYDTTLEIMKVWDDTGSAWKRLTPSSTEQANIDLAVAEPLATNIGLVAAIDDKVTDVAAIDDKVETVANITAGDISIVANITTGDISKVADITTGDISKVAAIDTEIGQLAVLGTAGADISTVAAIGTAGVDVSTVAGLEDEVALLGTPAMATAVTGHIPKVGANTAELTRYATEYTISNSAPGSPQDGHLWSDTNSNVLKHYNGATSSWDQVSSTGIANVADDLTPQLGGDLDTQTNSINLGALLEKYPTGSSYPLTNYNLSSGIDKLLLSETFIVNSGGDLTINGVLRLGKIFEEAVPTGVTLTNTGGGTITGSGTITNAAPLVQNYHTDFLNTKKGNLDLDVNITNRATGTFGSGINLSGSTGTFTSSHIIGSDVTGVLGSGLTGQPTIAGTNFTGTINTSVQDNITRVGTVTSGVLGSGVTGGEALNKLGSVTQGGFSSAVTGLGYDYLGSVGRATNNTANWSAGQNPNKGEKTHKIPLTSGIATANGTYQNFLIFIEGIDAFYDGQSVGFQFYCSNLENSGEKPVSSKLSYTYDARAADGSTSHGYSNSGTTVPLQAWSSGGMSGGSYSTYEHYRVQVWMYVTGVTSRQPPRVSWTTTSNYGGRTAEFYGQHCNGMATLVNGASSATYDNDLDAILICATGGHDDRRYLADQYTSNSVKLYGLRDVY
jgi:hypothetical protein